MKRILVPNKDGRYLRQSLEQAVDLAADLIAASECHHPIPPPSQISSRGTERETSAGDNNRSRCYCCSFINENRRALDSHQKLQGGGLQEMLQDRGGAQGTPEIPQRFSGSDIRGRGMWSGYIRMSGENQPLASDYSM